MGWPANMYINQHWSESPFFFEFLQRTDTHTQLRIYWKILKVVRVSAHISYMGNGPVALQLTPTRQKHSMYSDGSRCFLFQTYTSVWCRLFSKTWELGTSHHAIKCLDRSRTEKQFPGMVRTPPGLRPIVKGLQGCSVTRRSGSCSADITTLVKQSKRVLDQGGTLRVRDSVVWL